MSISNCSTITTGPVDNEIDKSEMLIVEAPLKYIDPLIEIQNFQERQEIYRSSLDEPISINNQSQERYFSYDEALVSKKEELEDVNIQLTKNGELNLIPGRSYHFSLESFCVLGKSPRPVKGDGFRISEMNGPAKSYLPYMLEHYSQKEISQNEMQNLIWALLSGLKFDELSDKNQSLLRLFYPDASRLFGNQAMLNMATKIIDEFLPDNIKSQLDYLSGLKDDFLKFQDNFKELESIMAPIESRSPIPVGWMKTEEGYYIKLTSDGGYTNVSVEIYVPDDLEAKDQRSPQSFKKLTFVPWKFIALPGSGQRLALSSKVKKYKLKSEISYCEKLNKWKPKNCKELTELEKEKILSISDPINFPSARYVSPPSKHVPIETEVDCSHFTHEIYHRLGIDFPYVSTSVMRCLNNFKEVSESEARPGDLVLCRIHVGILDKEGRVISATKGGERKRSTFIRTDVDFLPSITKYNIKTFGPFRFLRWSCK